MNQLSAVLDRLELELADHLGIRRDGLTMPPRIRECLTELRQLAEGRFVITDEDGEEIDVRELIGRHDALDDRLGEAEDELADLEERRDRLREELAIANGLAAWEWRRLPRGIAELLE
jgi:hypothetical protein